MRRPPRLLLSLLVLAILLALAVLLAVRLARGVDAWLAAAGLAGNKVVGLAGVDVGRRRAKRVVAGPSAAAVLEAADAARIQLALQQRGREETLGGERRLRRRRAAVVLW